MTAESSTRTRSHDRPRRQHVRRAFVPPQHGAWAFLALPWALGVTVAEWSPLLMPLALAWVAAYPMSYALFGLVRGRQPERFRLPLALWAAIVVPATAILVIHRPWLVWIGAVYAALLAVNVVYARRHDERSLVNDAAFVVECSAMVAVTWAVTAGQQSWTPPTLGEVPAHVWILVIVCAMTLWGSTLHVKALIRERGDARYRQASHAFAVLSVPVAIALAMWWGLPAGAWLVVPSAALAVRAYAVPRRALRPGMIGVIELGCFMVVVLTAWLAG